MWPMIGAVAGAALGALGSDSRQNVSTSSQGSQGSTNQAQSSFTPNEAALPFYGFNAGQGAELMQSPVPFFPGQTYVGPSAADQIGTAMQMGMIPMLGQAGMNMANNAGMTAPYYAAANQGYQGANNAFGYANSALGNAAGAYGQGAEAQRELLPGANENWHFLSTAADVAGNPYVERQADAMTRRINQNFREQLLPSINQGANQVNALGSSRHALAQAQGAERSQEQLSRGLADLYGNAYQRGLGAQQAALSNTGAMLQNQLAPAGALAQGGQTLQLGAQGLQRGAQGLQLGAQGLQQGNQDYAQNMASALGFGQAGVNAAMNTGQHVRGFQEKALQDAMARFGYQYAEPLSRMQLGQQVANFLEPLGVQHTSGSQYQQTSSQGTEPNPNYQSPIQGAIGGALTGASFGNDYLSDWFGGGGVE